MTRRKISFFGVPPMLEYSSVAQSFYRKGWIRGFRQSFVSTLLEQSDDITADALNFLASRIDEVTLASYGKSFIGPISKKHQELIDSASKEQLAIWVTGLHSASSWDEIFLIVPRVGNALPGKRYRTGRL
jgi:hypothetical protein